MDEFLSMKEVVRIVGLSRQEIWRRRHSGSFPQSVSLGQRKIVFVKAEIETWIAARKAERDAAVAARKKALE